jgi:hypothetical protein
MNRRANEPRDDSILSDSERIRRIKEFVAAMRASGITQEKLDAIERAQAEQEEAERRAAFLPWPEQGTTR